MGLKKFLILILFISTTGISSTVHAIPTPPDVAKKCKDLALAQIPGVPEDLVPVLGNLFDLSPLFPAKDHKCETRKCKGTMSEKECALSIVGTLACMTYQEVYSLCVSEHFEGVKCMDPVHKGKMIDWFTSLNNCKTTCLRRFPRLAAIKIEERILRWQRSAAQKVLAQLKNGKFLLGRQICAKLLTKVLGPIAVAYDVGQIGAYLIEEGGAAYIGWQDRKTACKLAQTALQIKNTNCAKRNASLERFSKTLGAPGCELFVEPATDMCGPTGIKTFELRGNCNPPPAIACSQDSGQTLDKLAAAMQDVASDSMACFISVRAWGILQTQCAIGTQPCDPTRRPE